MFLSEMNKLSLSDISRIIEMAWEDRTPFEAIEFQFGLKENDVREIMRRKWNLQVLRCGAKELVGERQNTFLCVQKK
jgi:uncharacterized protein (TIGR03643 family)